jgi:hypothetical protein
MTVLRGEKVKLFSGEHVQYNARQLGNWISERRSRQSVGPQSFTSSAHAVRLMNDRLTKR